jgi:hypothetical protein
MRQEQINSLEILSKFINDTSKEDLNALIKQYSNIGGPTYEEYLNDLQESCFVYHLQEDGLKFFRTHRYKLNCESTLLPQNNPPEKINIEINNPTFSGVSFLHTFVS